VIDPRAVVVLAAKELRDARRGRWFLLYAVALAALGLLIAGLAVTQQGAWGLAGFGRTSASLVNLVGLIVPLMGLTLGASSLAAERERGALLYLLTHPVAAGEVFLAKVLGLGLALVAAVGLGFGLAGAVIGLRAGGGHAGSFLALAGLTALLGVASLGLGLLISALARKAATAVGVAVAAWLVLVLLGDLGLMGTALALRLGPDQLLALALVNPLHAFKLAASVAGQGSLETLGPAGLCAARTFGAGLVPALLGILGAWAALPLAAGYVAFRWRGAA
jgi:Cu-processing system permease protein